MILFIEKWWKLWDLSFIYTEIYIMHLFIEIHVLVFTVALWHIWDREVAIYLRRSELQLSQRMSNQCHNVTFKVG